MSTRHSRISGLPENQWPRQSGVIIEDYSDLLQDTAHTYGRDWATPRLVVPPDHGSGKTINTAPAQQSAPCPPWETPWENDQPRRRASFATERGNRAAPRPRTPTMQSPWTLFIAAENRVHAVLVRYSIVALRISLGVVFFAFGVLKYFPGVSPAQNLAETTTHILFFGLVPGGVALVLIATLECAIGLLLISGRGLRVALYLLILELLGILSPSCCCPDGCSPAPRRPHPGRPIRPQRHHPGGRSHGHRRR